MGLAEQVVFVDHSYIVRSLRVVQPSSCGSDASVADQDFVVIGLCSLLVFCEPGGGELHGLVDS